MSVLSRARLGSNFPFAPENIFALDGGAIGVNAAVHDSSAADSSIVNQNKTSKWWNAIVIIQDNRCAGLNRETSDIIAR